VLVALAGVGLADRLRRREGSRTAPGLLAWSAWLTAAVVVAHALVIERAGIRWLPADRVADSAWLAFVLSAGAVVGGLVGHLSGARAGARPLLAVAAIALTLAVNFPTRPLSLLPPLLGWERAATIERGLRLDALWAALRSVPPGRVLFVRSGVPLAYARGWWRPHSHVTALTPRASGREIVNGTFTYPSPVAALFYRGDAGPGAIRELVERLDGRRLFGRNLDDLDTETLNAYADHLAVSTIVALDEDAPHLRALRDNPRFTRAPDSAPFVVYVTRSPSLLPEQITPTHLRLPAAPTGESWRSTHIAYYPLWHATANGKPIATRRGDSADLQVQSSDPNADIDLTYTPGPIELTGITITALSIVALTATTLRARRPRRID
jgi:hypothetical protein